MVMRTEPPGVEPPQSVAASTARLFGYEHERFARDLGRVRGAILAQSDDAAHCFGAFARMLRRHMRVEEGYLLAPLEAIFGVTLGSLTSTLRADHARIDELLDRADDSIHTGVDVIEALDALERAMDEHERTEARMLFPMCDRILSHEQRCTAARELDRKISGPPTLPGRGP